MKKNIKTAACDLYNGSGKTVKNLENGESMKFFTFLGYSTIIVLFKVIYYMFKLFKTNLIQQKFRIIRSILYETFF